MPPSDAKTGFSEPPPAPMQDASQYRQTIPIDTEDQDINRSSQQQDHPPPYVAPEPQRPAATHETATEQQAGDAANNTSCVDDTGYQASQPMTWEEKDRAGYWTKYDKESGCFCSDRGGYFCSDRGGWFFSDREGWWFSDRGGLCFSDRGGLCFSDNNGKCFS